MPDSLHSWLSTLDSIGSFGLMSLVIFAWLKGWIVRSDDVEIQISARVEVNRVHIEVLSQELAKIREDMASVIADRDAWRDAHRHEVAARLSYEASTVKLADAANTTSALLALLRDSLGMHLPASPPGTAVV